LYFPVVVAQGPFEHSFAKSAGHHDRFNIAKVRKTLQRNEVTISSLTPALIRPMLQSDASFVNRLRVNKASAATHLARLSGENWFIFDKAATGSDVWTDEAGPESQHWPLTPSLLIETALVGIPMENHRFLRRNIRAASSLKQLS